jgi:amino acid adenylation domain-containing protein/thioester reductase-like protein
VKEHRIPDSLTVSRDVIASDREAISPLMLTLVDLNQQQIKHIIQSVPEGARNVQDIYPLTPLQEGVLFDCLLNPGRDTYVFSTLLEFRSKSSVELWIDALNKVIDRHDVMRISIAWEEVPRPIQIVHRQALLQVRELTLDKVLDPVEQLKERMRPAKQQIFDLRQAPLARLAIGVHPHGETWYGLLQLHHLISDLQSLKVLVGEAMALLEGREQDLHVPEDYRGYVARRLADVNTTEEEAVAFFRSKLADIDEPTAPFGLVDVRTDVKQLKESSRRTGSVLTQQIRLQARRAGVSTARIFHAAWALVVAHTSGRGEAIFGTVLSATRHGGTAQGMLGLTVNTLPLRLQLRHATAADLVQQTHLELLELVDHANSPLAIAQRCSGLPGGVPLFTTLLNYRRSKHETEWDSPLGVRVLARGEAPTSYPIAISIDDHGEDFLLTVQTDSRIDPDQVLRYLEKAANSLAVALERTPETPALALQILPESERLQIVRTFNAYRTQLSSEKLIHELFETQVRQTPQAVAVLYENQSITYAELNKRSNRLARHLIEKGVRPDQLVGICVERGIDMVVGLLGILKAGGAYVPLDPAYPAERLAYILKDSAPRFVLTQFRLTVSLQLTTAELIEIDGAWSTTIDSDDTNLASSALGLTDTNLAYVIYTSGSTGQPKGAMNEHRGMVNRLIAQDKIEAFAEIDICCQKTSMSFVDAVFEIFGPLCTGRPLVVIPSATISDSAKMAAQIAEQRITRLVTVPSLARSMLESPNIMRNLSCLRSWTLSGEEVRAELLANLQRQLPTCEFIIQYGSSEVSSDAAIYKTKTFEGERVPIGRPLVNAQIYVLDSGREPVPIGVTGELYVGGVGVGRGYLNRPELTAERFLSNPFVIDSPTRLYKTGDLGRWLPDGTIEYLGRDDHQVKIRGFRIELGEIEAQLLRHEQVKEAVVLAREDSPGENRLVAYVVPRDQAAPELGAEELRSHLKFALPEYMVPSAFVVIKRMPLTPNGKIDRRSLPAPDPEAYLRRQYTSPQGEAEEILAGIWQSLLRVQRIGRQDNFFELGGHSLLIVQMMERLRRVGLSTEVRRVFESPTLADLASELTGDALGQFNVPVNLISPQCEEITPRMLPLVDLEPQQIECVVEAVPGGVGNIQDIYPLTPLQEGILFHHLFDERRGDTYVLPTVLSVASRDRLEELIAALQTLVDRHDILRTAVLWERLPNPVQVVYRQATLPVEEVELARDRDAADQIKEWMRPDRQRLDLRRAPLMRLKFAVDPRGAQHYVLLQLHHMTCDHVTMRALISEAVALLEKRDVALPESVTYRSHVAQTLAYIRTHDADAFFHDKLATIEEPTAPFGLLNVHGDGSEISEARDHIERSLAQRVRHQARRLGLSAAALFHAAWALVVAHTSGRDEVVYGTVLLGRLHGSANAQRILGMFVNTLPLRLQLPDLTAEELAELAQRELVQLLSHEQASLAVAQRCSGLVGSAPLFTTLLNYRHKVPDPDAEWASAAGIQVLTVQERTNYPITLSVDDLEEGFALTAQTDRRIDPHRVMGYMHAAIQSLVEALEQRSSHVPALALSILPPNERRQVLEVFNSKQATYPKEKLIHELLERQVERTPDGVAVVYEGESLTYAEINGKANQLARYLRDKGVGSDQLVGICVERSVEMVTAILGVLKAGAAYVPLDPNYPAERLAYVLNDAAPKLLLIQESLRKKLPETVAEVITLDHDWPVIAQQSSANLDAKALSLGPHNLAYVIYTSGSTGEPKGVMVEHRNVTRLFSATDGWFTFNERDVWTLFHSVAFDFSVWEIWGALLYGGRLVVVPHLTARSPQEFYRLLCEEKVTILNQTPSAFAQLIEAQGQDLERQHSLRVVIFGGEALEFRTLQPWLARNGADRPQLVNMYGITETTVHVTYRLLSKEEIESERGSLIGAPIPDLRMYLLDRHKQPVPIGVAGEIYVGGAGVARGYLNRLELTAERFIPDPFSAEAQAHLYKTGDLGLWRADGTIEYLGRNDHQVKIRGFRIELGEIEAHLVRHAKVKEAVVIAREDVPGEKRLVAYVIATDPVGAGATPSVEALRTHLKAAVPEHMVPSAFVLLERIPLTSNGKLDRRALPAPDLGAYNRREYEAPKGDVEEILAGIWQELLRVERVGRQDNFFELGGHSLMIVQMMERLRRVGLSTEVRRVFESLTFADLANELTSETIGQSEVPPNLIPLGCESITPQMLPLVDLEAEQIERIVHMVPGGPANVQDIYPLAPLQEGILFHHLLDEHGGDTYVLTTLLSVSSRMRLNELITALQRLIDRHDVLRSAVLWEQLPRPVQVVYRQATLPVRNITLDPNRNPTDQLSEWVTPERQRLNMRQAPLMHLQIAADPRSDQWYALLQLHHIFDDATSQELVLLEVMTYLEGRSDTLPQSMPYRNHVAQALAHARAHDATAFFRAKLADIHEPTTPFGLLDVRGDRSRFDIARLSLEATLARRIRAEARRLGVSVAALFHVAWGLVVSHTSGRDDVVFGTVLLGRLQGSAGAHRTLGMFINTLPLRLKLRDVASRRLVEQTQRELVQLLNYEQASLAEAQRCSSIPGTGPLFSALLNYRHITSNLEAEFSSAAGVEVLGTQGWTNYPFTLSVDDLGDGFTLTVDTERRVNPHRVVNYVHRALQSLVEALEFGSQQPVLSLSIFPEKERHQVLEEFNETQAEYPHERLIHEMFEEQVERTPNSVAVFYEGQSLTYTDLNKRSNQLARYLRENGVGPEQLVGICVERSLEMVVGLLGVLKAGGAYIPLNPADPQERLAYMLNDSAPKIVLTQDSLKNRLPGTAPQVVALDKDWIDIAQRPSDNLKPSSLGLNSRHLAYVIYTSGSTGQPKGAMNEHRGVVNRLQWMQDAYGLTHHDRVLQKTPFTFDVSVWEFFWTLLSGARLVVARPQGHQDPTYLRKLIEETGVTTLHFVPSMLQIFLDQHETDSCASLKHIVCSGEELSAALRKKCFECLPQMQLSNLYGPTEAAVDVTAWECDPKDQGPRVPIGRPISNIRMYVLDDHLRPVPIGVAGELYIAGVGVGRGYANRAGLTAERFIPDPFSASSRARMYKTGDRAQWRADGAIEYLGRNDHQVKIRGFRIELGEIEAQLAQHSQVKEAVVLAREDVPGEKRLVAYVVGDRYASLKASSDKAAEKLRSEIVSEWETLYEATYGTQNQVAGPNFVGWNSSYTGQPIPEPQMQEWLDSTVSRIKALEPNRVLEIGCGVGLLVQRLAPHCLVYVGTDFSASALAQLRKLILRQQDLDHVELLHRSATELHDLQAHSFDTVILNSVVQYFPDIDYLLAVLQGVVRLLRPGGKIFIGDVRHLGLLPMFHSAVQLSKASATVSVGQLKTRIARAVAQDKELVIEPQFFRVLPGNLSGISAAEVHLKRAQSENELTRYRYDVTLQVGEPISTRAVCEPIDWPTAVGSVAEFEASLSERRWCAARIYGIPNQRLTREAAAQTLIKTSEDRLEAGTLRLRLDELSFEEAKPEKIWELAEAHDYDVTVSPGDQNCLEVRLLDRCRRDQVARALPEPGSPKPWSAYANDPLENGIRQQLIPRLREYLAELLPEYMVPSAWMVLKQLPLSPNGKIDRRALPIPHSRPEELDGYIAPSSEMERTLANIWSQVLRVDQIGVQDNFFELGGHSLLAIRALSRINQCFGSALSVVDLYSCTTIRELVKRICGDTTADDFVDLSKEAVLDAAIIPSPGLDCAPPRIAMLTGCTGFVGRFLLTQLLRDTDATIYCLIRAQSAQHALSRLRTSLSKWDLWRDEFERRIVAIPGNLNQPHLGLDEPVYQALCQAVDVIYHCGTSMNHLESYAMAKSANVEGAIELLKIATQQKTKVINYISTLGIFSSFGTDTARVVNEETPIEHEKHQTSHGYLASKWVSEKIFMLASERGIPCNIFRLGLVWADTEQGRYDPLQWGDRILKSCLLSGFGIKNYRYELPPTPVDYVSHAVAYLANRHPEGQRIFHISSLDHMVEGIFERCNEIAATSLKLVSFYEWICEVKRLHHAGRSLPAVPLIEFAFSMDERDFHEHMRHVGSANVRFTCARTHKELERAGIPAPELNDDLLRVYLANIYSRDGALRQTLDGDGDDRRIAMPH